MTPYRNHVAQLALFVAILALAPLVMSPARASEIIIFSIVAMAAAHPIGLPP